ncbi:MFS transporter [Dermabacter sp. p3-SID358]|uniref:MFS transporter n=1 Tax=Dermabacter sp. p3-SID358 TaxID=2916114 RepID=UPI0021A925C3|nr:MFS transporter [Dermabacter sp. p3-SID358]MCT1866625.1 MFS transporter [Dermabacter sp. p3-SID358]
MSAVPPTVTGSIPAINPEADPSSLPEAAPSNENERSNWIAVVALALGIFTLITIEELPIGVLTLISNDLGVSRGTVGLAVTLPGVIAGVVALLVPSVTRPLNRKTVLLLALLSVVVSCAVSFFSTSWPLFLASRLFTGIAIGMNWPVLPLVATGQVKKKDRTTAMTIAFAGNGSALVLGLPLATWLGTVFGWRGAFAATGILALIVGIVMIVMVRPVQSASVETVRSTLGAVRIRGVRYAFVLTLIIVTGQFISYSYVSPILQDFAHVDVERISMYLLLYGTLGLIGNFAAGPLIKRSAALAVLVLAVGSALALTLVATVMSAPTNALVIIAVWGFFGGMASVSIQSLVNAEAGDRVEAGTALNSAAFNISIGGGAIIGGLIVDSAGLRAAVWVSTAAIALGALIVTRFIALTHRRASE